jgi:hypothetical protein
VAGTPDSRALTALAPLWSRATARPRQVGTSFVSQAATSRQAVREPAHRDLSTLRPDSTAIPARLATPTPSLNQAATRAPAATIADDGT